MARSLKEIKKTMTDLFMSDAVIREKYGLKEGDTFDSAFSQVSLENILFGIIATAMYVMENLFDRFKTYVDKQIAASNAATIPWYHRICLQYQHGDDLLLNEATLTYEYATIDPSKQIVKYAACRDKGGYVYILVSGEDADGYPTVLSDGVLTPFENYIKRLKPAGVQLEIHSYIPDSIKINVTIQRNSLLINSDGALIDNTAVFPVEDAVNRYLESIEFGGVLNKTRLSDYIQQATGVLDVRIDSILVRSAISEEYVSVVGNNYESVGGAFRAVELRDTISYETVQI